MKGLSVRDLKDRGAAAVEMAIMAMFLMILVMGIIDVGRAIFTNISIQEAAQEGAYYSAFEETVTVAEIKQRAVDSTSSPALATSDVTVACVTQSKSKKNGTRIQVTVSHDLNLLTPIISQWWGGSLTLSKKAEVERFFSTCPA